MYNHVAPTLLPPPTSLPPSLPPCLPGQGSHSGSPPVAGVSSKSNIGDLLFEAMEDTPTTAANKSRLPISSSTRTSTGNTSRWQKSAKPTTAGGGRAATGVSKRSQVKIQVAGEKSVEILIDSDSDDENSRAYQQRQKMEGGVAGRGVVSSSHTTPSPTTIASGSDIFSESEDDFCLVDIPTASKMVS